LSRSIDGRGVTVGVLSDSYDRAKTTLEGQPLTIHAAQDVASGDLPGKGNARYPQPVVVVDDSYADGEDEGRGMLQIIHDVAPAGNNQGQGAWAGKAKLVSAAKGLRGTNLDFSGVDPALYDGGLQDMKPGRGIDVAQTVAIGPSGGSVMDVQWDDPVDLDGAT